MALHDVKVPQLSESVAEAALLQWKKQPGEAVAQDEILIEIETDKVVLEVPAPAAGVLSEHVKVNGDMVVSDEVIARIDTNAKASAAPAPASEKPAEPATASSASPVPTPPTSTAAALPAAAKLMAETGVSLAQGSGKGGRITKGDVLAAQSATAAQASAPTAAALAAKAVPATAGLTQGIAAPVSASSLPAVNVPMGPEAMLEGRPEQRVPMSRLRARVAERLLQSQASNAILTTFNEVNMAPVMALRKQYVEVFEKEHGVKLGFMSFFVKAAVAALKKYPVLNASVDGNDIVYHGYFDIGIAVGSPRGLVVPIIRNADQLTFAEIEKTISDFGVRAREGKITLEELTGGTFSISNGGVFGSMLSTPIINPPQSAILGIHATKERPVVENGQIVIRPMNYLAMSYDHRIIDGREAVLGLVTMKDALEDPARLLLEI
ncbi:MAG: 2-oxoglutarate dehydrogenase complex dihydrolipoyllysine-residue succinyltransferase [Burkholderiaceae bacterium]|nr:2-oxoglutarate dehydrogenase complex dihydrolipoyllysine-residue succinyltransferase [Burkholderiaceae bacterium]